MKEQVVKYTPYGVAALGGVIGYVLHKKFGMACPVGAIGIGAVSGYFISKAIIDKTSGTSESGFNNAVAGIGCPYYRDCARCEGKCMQWKDKK